MAPPRLARGTILAAATLTIMAPAVVAPSLPAMEQTFAAEPGASLLVRLAMTITSLMIAISAPVSGLVADRIGRRPLLVSSLVLYTASGTAGYFVTDLPLLVVTRALLGIAIGGVMTAVSATITDWFDGPERASFLGLQQAFASLGGMVFLPLAGVLATVSWRVPFWLYSLGAVVAVFAILAVRDTPRDTPAVTAGRERAPTGRVFGIYALALGVTMAFYMAPTQVPFLLDDLGIGPAIVGVVLAGSTLTGALGALWFPMLRRRLRFAAITTVAVALLGAGWLLVGSTGTAFGTAAGLLLGGIGVGLAVPNVTLRLSELAPPAWRGRILSGLISGIFLGQFLSPLAAQPLIEAVGVGGVFSWAGTAMVAGAGLAAVGAWKRNTH
ncbi:putative MFS family arabinose efflux permease [Murinocardiopsis flavida]|uniref:Putative MFS family arabinose efflux permease n=2 Tax=Murinocardiopsis flavida TaxID=645275 RepID=A0A2P8DHT6_9ACTN|nr:putative MFS family arabinose efflux permease [Murinocardiopsis flavida]